MAKSILLPLTETLGDAQLDLRRPDGLVVHLETDRHPEGGWVVRAAFKGRRAFMQANRNTCGAACRAALLALVPDASETMLASIERAGESWEART